MLMMELVPCVLEEYGASLDRASRCFIPNGYVLHDERTKKAAGRRIATDTR